MAVTNQRTLRRGNRPRQICSACGDHILRGPYCPDCSSEISLRSSKELHELATLIFRLGARARS
jgi:predicted amidophosphoribosyltransferase